MQDMKSALQSLLGSTCPNCDYRNVRASSSSNETCAVAAAVLVPTSGTADYKAKAETIKTMITNVR